MQNGLGLRQRQNAVSNVTWRDDAHVVAQTPRSAAVVGNRHDRRNVRRIAFQPAKKRRKPRPAADGNDARTAQKTFFLPQTTHRFLRLRHKRLRLHVALGKRRRHTEIQRRARGKKLHDDQYNRTGSRTVFRCADDLP